MPPLGFVPISPPQEGDTETLPKIGPAATHAPHLQETELVFPPQHIQTFLKKEPGVSWGFGHAGKGQDGTGKLGWDGGEESGVCTLLRCKCRLVSGLRRGGEMRQNHSCGDAVLPRAHFLSPKWQPRGYLPRELISSGFLSTLKKQTQASQPVLCCGTEPSRLAWLASHKGSIKVFIKMLPFISAR